jgi:ABC-type uncharacterized transport system permease subunit
MTLSRAHLATLPLVTRFAIVGATACAILGGLVGLILGLRSDPATAWFAVFEVAVPAGIAGAVVGALVGLLAVTVQRINHH